MTRVRVSLDIQRNRLRKTLEAAFDPAEMDIMYSLNL